MENKDRREAWGTVRTKIEEWGTAIATVWDAVKTKVGEWWEGTSGARDKIVGWYNKFKDETLPQWGAKAAEVWDAVKAKIGEWWDGLEETFKTIKEWFNTFTTETAPKWAQAIKDACADAKDAIQNDVLPAIAELRTALDQELKVSLQKGREVWQEWIDVQQSWLDLWGTLKAVWDLFHAILWRTNDQAARASNLWNDVKQAVGEALDPFKKLNDRLDSIKKGLGQINDALIWFRNLILSAIQALNDLAAAIPDWLKPGSPPPLELGLMGINDQLRRMAGLTVPIFATPLMGAGAGEGLVAAGGGAMGYQINNYFGQDSVRSEDDIYRLAEQIDRSLALRGLQRVLD